MNGRIFVPSRGPADWRDLLADDGHWRSGRSAMAAARCWEAASGLPREIGAILGGDAELLLAIPEHKVQMPGRGRASQCDVFALLRMPGGLCAVSVEAKVSEPFGETVRDWNREASGNKADRLAAICTILGLASPPGPELRYQLFHRTAAAVIEADRFGASMAAMVVHSFSQDHEWFGDFAAFCRALGVEAERGVPLRAALPGGLPLILGWATGPPDFLTDEEPVRLES